MSLPLSLSLHPTPPSLTATFLLQSFFLCFPDPKHGLENKTMFCFVICQIPLLTFYACTVSHILDHNTCAFPLHRSPSVLPIRI